MSGVEHGELELRIREPAGQPEGALILNHGRGADEHDLFGLFDELDPERRLLGISPGAPIVGLPSGGRHWYVVERVGYPHAETFARSVRMLTGRLDSVLAERSIPWSRTVIGGFSQGAVMSYATVAGRGRPRPAGLFALSGFIPEVEGWQPELANLDASAVYIHHGADDPVIGVEFARTARERLLEAGVEPRYKESSAGHSLPLGIVPELREFVATTLATTSGVVGS